MKSIQDGMNVGRQLRKLDAVAGDVIDRQVYVAYCKGLMLASVAMGAPQPASQFIPMIEEEFDV